MSKKTYYSEAEKQALMSSQQGSGSTKKAFSKAEGINYSVFRGWFYRDNKPSLPLKMSRFCQLTSKATAPISTQTKPHSIHLRLPNGCQVDFPHDLTPQQWQTILSALGVTPC